MIGDQVTPFLFLTKQGRFGKTKGRILKTIGNFRQVNYKRTAKLVDLAVVLFCRKAETLFD
jgi:hypothetical protein